MSCEGLPNVFRTSSGQSNGRGIRYLGRIDSDEADFTPAYSAGSTRRIQRHR